MKFDVALDKVNDGSDVLLAPAATCQAFPEVSGALGAQTLPARLATSDGVLVLVVEAAHVTCDYPVAPKLSSKPSTMRLNATWKTF